MAWPINMAVHLAATFRSDRCNQRNYQRFPLYPYAYYLIIKLPNSEILKIFYRIMLFASLLASFPCMKSVINKTASSSSSSSSFTHYESVMPGFDSAKLDRLLSLFFRDLTNEGLLKKNAGKSVFLSDGNEENLIAFQSLADYNIHLIPLNDLEKQSNVLDGTVDFIVTFNFAAASHFIDRTLKTGGVATVLSNDSPSAEFYKPSNYRIAYMRRLHLVAVAMWKTGVAETEPHKHRKLLSGSVSDAKKAALQKLEDVLLEPPRSASKKSSRYMKRTRYLPDLMGDSLESHPRRVFIDVGLPEKDGTTKPDWFATHYPTRNKDFEIYKIETVTEEANGKEGEEIGMSQWMRKNVKEEEYVVMKAEAELVEDLVRSKAIKLVDELFLDCKPQLGGERKRRRAYWECLALYGKLRDEGVAVHQWWG